jgi:hypothetical protein
VEQCVSRKHWPISQGQTMLQCWMQLWWSGELLGWRLVPSITAPSDALLVLRLAACWSITSLRQLHKHRSCMHEL